MLCIALNALTLSIASQAQQESQLWQAHLNVADPEEGGVADLNFGLELSQGASGWRAFLINEPERIAVPRVEWNGKRLVLSIDHYDSRIEAELDEQGVLRGTWEKVRGKDKLAQVPFWASPAEPKPKRTRAVLARSVAGRWDVDFSSDDLGSVGIFEQKGAQVNGTFMTATGDYRFLAGELQGKALRLSCFDGAHAFLFEAELGEDDTLQGSFHSGNWWKESWTAKRDDTIQMTDGFAQTTWDERTSLAELNFLDEAGALRSLAEPDFLGQATIVQLFGTWCPNCHDETRYLVELHKRYAERGLRVVGLAFELSGEFERDTKQLGVFRKRHDVPYPLLLAGTADKSEASLAFPAIDRLRSFPTSIFIDSSGRIRGLHSGFAGPATGDEHLALRKHYESWIEALLSEEPAPLAAAMMRLDGSTWQQPGGPMRVAFAIDANGYLQAVHTPLSPQGAVRLAQGGPESVTSPVTLRGDALWFGGQPWRLDERVGSLAQTQDYGRRLFEQGAPARGVVRELSGVGTDELLHIAGDTSPRDELEIMRVEALILLAYRGASAPDQVAAIMALTKDSSHRVRLAALYALGELEHKPARALLIKHLKHPNAAERREAVNALIKIGELAAQLKAECEELWPMIDRMALEMLK